jgi:hypothetical protein
MKKMGEQIGRTARTFVNADWSYAKRVTSRARRRAEKRDPENAPKRNEYSGWVD